MLSSSTIVQGAALTRKLHVAFLHPLDLTGWHPTTTTTDDAARQEASWAEKNENQTVIVMQKEKATISALRHGTACSGKRMVRWLFVVIFLLSPNMHNYFRVQGTGHDGCVVE